MAAGVGKVSGPTIVDPLSLREAATEENKLIEERDAWKAEALGAQVLLEKTMNIVEKKEEQVDLLKNQLKSEQAKRKKVQGKDDEQKVALHKTEEHFVNAKKICEQKEREQRVNSAVRRVLMSGAVITASATVAAAGVGGIPVAVVVLAAGAMATAAVAAVTYVYECGIKEIWNNFFGKK